MHTQYQLIILDDDHPFKLQIVDTFLIRMQELGIDRSSATVLYAKNFKAEYRKNSPSVALYFGKAAPFHNEDILEELITDAVFILPIVNDLKQVTGQLPEAITPLNAFEFTGAKDIETLVARIMEGLSLLRTSRRLFISYRRAESRSIAIQLYEHLDACGFDVFLDTHSIRSGEPFQDELWHRLVDTDIVVLLDTPGFLESEWTAQELAKASAMSVGVLQIVWPRHDQAPYSSLCFPLYLKKKHFKKRNFRGLKSNLTKETLSLIGSEVESLRARCLAARQDNLIQEFTSTAKNLKISTVLYPEKFLTLQRLSDGQEVSVIPTVGVPQAFTFNQCEELVRRVRSHNSKLAFLLYDHRNILRKWETHLSWLNKHLPVKTVKVVDLENWMKTL